MNTRTSKTRTPLTAACVALVCLLAFVAASPTGQADPVFVKGQAMLKQEEPKDKKDKKPKNCNPAHPCPVPDAVPVAAADASTGQEDRTQVVAVLANDSGLEDGGLQVAVSSGPQSGTAWVGADMSVSYRPAADFSGADFLSYTVTDADGDSSSARVDFTVTAVDDPPVAADDSATTSEDFPVTIFVLNNDHDPEGTPVSLTGVGAPLYGSAGANSDGSVLYTPSLNDNRTDTFTYTITDASGATSSGTVVVNITAVDDSVRARGDGPFTTTSANPVNVAVLVNDSYPDGFGSVALEFAPSGGTVTLNPDNTFTYTPSGSFSGRDYFAYLLRDSDGDTGLAWVAIDVF